MAIKEREMAQGYLHPLSSDAEKKSFPETEVLAMGSCCGSVGELWQGPLWTGTADEVALVTLHGPNQSIAYVGSARDGEIQTEQGSENSLRQRATELFYQVTGFSRIEARMRYLSDIPRGKGMASSTADIVAVVRCLFALHGEPFSEATLRTILLRIERSDPVFSPRHAIYFSGLQREYRSFSSRLSYYAFWSFSDQIVKTHHFDRQVLLAAYAKNREAYRDSLSRLINGLELGSRPLVAAEATESARLAQSYLPSERVQLLLRNQFSLGALGVVRGHTGSVAGLLFAARPEQSQRERLRGFFRQHSMNCYEGSVGLC